MRRLLLVLALSSLSRGDAAEAEPPGLPPLNAAAPVTAGPPVTAAPAEEAWPGQPQPVPCPSCPGPTALAPAEPGAGSVWKNVPPTHPAPRTGNFTVPPTGPGYYTALDWLVGNERKTPPKYPYPSFALIQPSFFDFSFAYLDDPKLAENDRDYADVLKRIHLGDDLLLSTGGQTWWRHMDETNSRLQGQQHTYDLWRARAFADLWVRDCVRVYAEFITAQAFNLDLGPLAIDRNYADLLNAFIEVKLAEIEGKNAYLRVGRQELLLGSQRLVSTLDWANTRRTFQGVRGYRVGEKWDVDLFWVQPIVPVADRFDSVDNNKNFVGAWVTHRPKQGTFLDAYYLFLDDTNRVRQRGIVQNPSNVHTLGVRAAGNEDRLLYDGELMFQVGELGSQAIVAGAAHGGLGWNFKDVPTKPVLWVCYDYASGDNNPNVGTVSTFNQLFPFGHYYLGWLDLVGRQNIHDVNVHLFAYPTNWMTLWFQYHHFQLAARRDALYSAGGVALRRDPTGRAGSHVGDELDIVTNFHLTNHSDFMVGYSRMFAGNFLRRTATNAAQAVSPDLFYMMYSYRW